MLFKRDFKAGIRAGRITRTYRNWKRIQARVGGRYNLAPDGIIEVSTISRVSLNTVTDRDARAAGFDDRNQLRDYLGLPADAGAYRIDFRYLGAGKLPEPAREKLDAAALADLSVKLCRMDNRAAAPWTRQALELIGSQPGIRAAELAPTFGWDTASFKGQIRKLKAFGLTISLETGYQLSPRGRQLLEEISRS